MGLSECITNFIDQNISVHLSSYSCKRMLELGNQTIRGAFTPESIGKEYYLKRGFEHISLDLNGQDGALKVDISKSFKCKQWRGYFDVVTNAGTSEHIEPFRRQYQCFRNIHESLRRGGLAIHIVPDAEKLAECGAWKGHCNYYYSKSFFRLLAERNGYSILSFQYCNNLLCVCLRKDNDQTFMRDKSELLNAIVRKRGGRIYRGINDSRQPLRTLRGTRKKFKSKLFSTHTSE